MILYNKRTTKALIRLRFCAFVVHKPPKTSFLAAGPDNVDMHLYANFMWFKFTKYHGETDSRSADRRFVQFFVCDNLCRLLTDIYANSLEPVQDRQNVGSDLDPYRLKG